MNAETILQKILSTTKPFGYQTKSNRWDNFTELLSRLDRPEQKLKPVIHIAGTNGKGSTLAMLGSILNAHGKRYHAFTSPHLVHFNERFIINGKSIDDTLLKQCYRQCEQALAGLTISTFDYFTAIAFLAFSQIPTDYIILETGVGGRLDATNIIKNKILTIITSIDLDHQSMLGNSISDIAKEKVGIIRPNTPLILGKTTDAATNTIIEVANQNAAPSLIYQQDWQVKLINHQMDYQNQHHHFQCKPPALVGSHQIRNAGIAITASLHLLKDQFSPIQLEKGLTQAKWPGRMQHITTKYWLSKLPKDAELWLDGAHNAQGFRALANCCQSFKQQNRSVILIMGCGIDKKPSTLLQPLIKLITYIYTVELPKPLSSTSQIVLAQAANALNIPVIASVSVADALTKINQKKWPKPPSIIICGSLYLAKAVLAPKED